jgi:hypothetical protein
MENGQPRSASIEQNNVVENERLRKAVEHRYASTDQFAKKAGFSEKTATRLLEGTKVLHATRLKAVEVLDGELEDYWPELYGALANTNTEFIGMWPRRSDCPANYWWNHLLAADRHINLLGYAALFLTENHADLVELLATRANNGCSVRIILADPDATATKDRDKEEGLEGGLVSRIRTSLKYLEPLKKSAAQLRLQSIPMYNSVFRLNDDMLFTPHLYATPGKEAPLYHFHRVGNGGTFDQYLRHFEGVWGHARPLWASPMLPVTAQGKET